MLLQLRIEYVFFIRYSAGTCCWVHARRYFDNHDVRPFLSLCYRGTEKREKGEGKVKNGAGVGGERGEATLGNGLFHSFLTIVWSSFTRVMRRSQEYNFTEWLMTP